MTTILLYLFLKGVAMWKIIILCIIKQIKRHVFIYIYIYIYEEFRRCKSL